MNNYLSEKIIEVMRLYGRMPRALTLVEVRRAVGEEYALSDIIEALDVLVQTKRVSTHFGFYSIDRETTHALAEKRIRQDVVADEKWKKFLQLRKFFAYIPFVEFVYAAGSMAMGNVGAHSDFDVLIGAKKGRIFSTRFFCIILFGALRRRRKKFSHHEDASNTICLNHFVTKLAYRLSPPYNLYWRQLYKSFIPLYGSGSAIKAFAISNEWAAMCSYHDRRWYYKEHWTKKFFEAMLGGWLGDFIERVFKVAQEWKIAKNFHERGEIGHAPRIRHDDTELEFHPDTRRIEEMIKIE